MRYARILIPIALVLFALAVGVAWFFNDQTSGLFETIAHADEMVVYAGLPYEGSEYFETEKVAYSTRQIGGFYFYAEPETLSEVDARKLRELLVTRYSSPPGSDTKCGGFHPDFAVQFRQGKTPYTVLICFTCMEARIVGPWQTSRHSLSTFDKTRSLLTKYVKDWSSWKRR